MARRSPITIVIFLIILAIAAAAYNSRSYDEADYAIRVIGRYIQEGRIVTGKKSNTMEDFLPTETGRFMGGFAFYNILFDARQFAKQNNGLKVLRVDESYVAEDLNIYFIGSSQDSYGLLKSANIQTAVSYPRAHLVIVNSDFLKDLFRSRITVGTIDAATKTDFLQLELEKPVEGVKPYTLEELNDRYNMFIGIYVVLHEIGHVLLNHDDVFASHTDNQKENEADQFYVRLFTNMITNPELVQNGLDFRFIFYGDLIDSLHTYASYTTLKELGKRSNELIYSDDPVELKQYFQSRHPHMMERICRLFSFIRGASRPENYTTATPDAYARLCRRLIVRRTLWP